MIVEVSSSEVGNIWFVTIIAHASQAFVQLRLVILEILEHTLDFALFSRIRSKRLVALRFKANVLEGNARIPKRHFQFRNSILKIQRLYKKLIVNVKMKMKVCLHKYVKFSDKSCSSSFTYWGIIGLNYVHFLVGLISETFMWVCKILQQLKFTLVHTLRRKLYLV